MKTYTRRELAQMKPEELADLQKSLAQYIGTEEETAARRLNSLIQDEKAHRNPPIFGGNN